MSRGRRTRLTLALGIAGAAVGCVSPGRYQEAARERDAAQEEIVRLEASVTALDAERESLAGALEDMRLERDEALRASESRAGDCQAELAAQTARVDELNATYQALVRDLEAQVAVSNSKIDRLREGTRMSLPAGLLFDSGSAELTDEGTRVIADLGRDLRGDTYAGQLILVEGHTDGVAVRGALQERYPTNWELAGARAARVVRALEAAGVEGTRLSAVSRGAAQPVAPDDTEAGRAANRRIEIRLIPLDVAPAAPAPAGTGSGAEGAPPPEPAAR